MHDNSIDILMITYNRPEYTRLSLERLLETCDENMRVWIWHNGNDEKTLAVVNELSSHPRIHEVRVSPENRKLNVPTNWLWSNAKGRYLSKLDDDCLLSLDWARTLRKAHEDVPNFGVLGCWRFPEEDFIPELANEKIQEYNGHHLMRNCWVEGSGYLMKRECLDRQGLLEPAQSFTSYCIELAHNNWINGWYYPFIYQEHFDDPRAPHTGLKSDRDFAKFTPLTANNNKVQTLEDWRSYLKENARGLQAAPINPLYYQRWRKKIREARQWALSLVGMR